jgi:hypothetical protein
VRTLNEKKEIKISLSTFFLIIAIIVIIIMGYSIYNLSAKNSKKSETVAVENDSELAYLNNDENIVSSNKENETNNTSTVNTTTNNTNTTDSTSTTSTTNTTSSYNSNFSNSVFDNLDENATIVVPIWAYSGYSNITINSKHEAYWHNQGNDTFPETSNTKVADNVINAWYCPLGQDIESNACLLFLKEDGSVTYIRFYIEKSTNEDSFVSCTEEKTLKGISGISNVLVVENGFYGAMLIKEDGTRLALDLTKLDDLTDPN